MGPDCEACEACEGSWAFRMVLASRNPLVDADPRYFLVRPSVLVFLV